MDTEVGRGGQKQTLFTTLHERYLRRAVTGILKVAWEVVKDLHAAKFDRYGMRDDKGRAGCENSVRIAALAQCVPCARKLYLAMSEKYFLESMTRRLGAALKCFVASCSLDGGSFDKLK